VRLSLARAKLVRDQLIAHGVDPTRIAVAAFADARAASRGRVLIWGRARHGAVTRADRRPP
jgi:flagellar motor protein MotB